MNYLQQMQALVKEFGELHGVGDLVPDESGYVAVEFDEDLILTMQLNQHSGLLTMFAVIATLSNEHADPVMRDILAANLFWQGTGGATIGVDPADQEIIMAERFHLEGLEVSHFEAVVDEFVRHVVAWRAHLHELEQADGEAGPIKPRFLPQRDIIRG